MASQWKVWLHSAAAGLVLIAYLPFFKALVRVSATNPYAGHVIFVPIFAVVLLGIERRQFRGLTGRGSVSGLGLTVFALALAGTGYRTANMLLQALSLVIALVGLGLWVYGMRGVRGAGFVLAFLLLMVPPPRDVAAALVPTLQQFAAGFSGFVLNCLGIPVEQQGVLLRLPGLTLEIAEECAGLRFSLTLFVFVSAFARVVLPTMSLQFLLMTLSIPVAVLANATRVAVTSIGAYAIGPEVATGQLHFYIGKSFWALGLLAMIGFALLLRSRIHEVDAGDSARPGACVAGAPARRAS